MIAEDGKLRLTDVANPETLLAELSTRQIAETMEATGMKENKVAGKKGGGIAKKARLDLEHKTGRKVITTDNYLPPQKSPDKLNGGKKWIEFGDGTGHG